MLCPTICVVVDTTKKIKEGGVAAKACTSQTGLWFRTLRDIYPRIRTCDVPIIPWYHTTCRLMKKTFQWIHTTRSSRQWIHVIHPLNLFYVSKITCYDYCFELVRLALVSWKTMKLTLEKSLKAIINWLLPPPNPNLLLVFICYLTVLVIL